MEILEVYLFSIFLKEVWQKICNHLCPHSTVIMSCRWMKNSIGKLLGTANGCKTLVNIMRINTSCRSKCITSYKKCISRRRWKFPEYAHSHSSSRSLVKKSTASYVHAQEWLCTANGWKKVDQLTMNARPINNPRESSWKVMMMLAENAKFCCLTRK